MGDVGCDGGGVCDYRAGGVGAAGRGGGGGVARVAGLVGAGGAAEWSDVCFLRWNTLLFIWLVATCSYHTQFLTTVASCAVICLVQ